MSVLTASDLLWGHTVEEESRVLVEGPIVEEVQGRCVSMHIWLGIEEGTREQYMG